MLADTNANSVHSRPDNSSSHQAADRDDTREPSWGAVPVRN